MNKGQLVPQSQLLDFKKIEWAVNRKFKLDGNKEPTEIRSLVPRAKSHLSTYLLQRVKLEPLEITEETYMDILGALNSGLKYLVIGGSLIMLNTITSIDLTTPRQKFLVMRRDKEQTLIQEEMLEPFEKGGWKKVDEVWK
jgi:hypothetical protein